MACAGGMTVALRLTPRVHSQQVGGIRDVTEFRKTQPSFQGGHGQSLPRISLLPLLAAFLLQDSPDFGQCSPVPEPAQGSGPWQLSSDR